MRSLYTIFTFSYTSKSVETKITKFIKKFFLGFPYGPVVRILPANARDMGSIPGPGIFHMPWHNQAPVPHIQPSCLETHLCWGPAPAGSRGTLRMNGVGE